MLTTSGLARISLLVLLAAGTALAQTTTATLSGVIRDAQNAVVPDAQISVTSADSGTKRTTIRTTGLRK